jgi:hypothetical protein
MDPKYDALAYPHTMHRRYVRGCEACLARTKAAQRRYTESKRRQREAERARCAHDWTLQADDTRVCVRCYQRTTL